MTAGAVLRRLWLAHSVSELGTQVTQLALPLTAAVVLNASPWQMGLLTAAGLAPYPMLALPVGAWVDRLPYRPVLVTADLARAVLLASIPVAAVLGTLGLVQLGVVMFLTGGFSVLFDLARASLVPQLLTAAELGPANSRFSASSSVAQTAGPGVGALLVQVVSAPLAIALDAVSFALSALLLRRMPGRTRPRDPQGRLGAEIAAGLRFVAGDPVLRTVAFAIGAINLCGLMAGSMTVLYGVRELGLSGGVVGALVAVAGIGALAGSILAARLGRARGLGMAAVLGAALYALSPALLPAAHGPGVLSIVLFGAAQLLLGCGIAVLDVNVLTLRQLSTPDSLQGRVGAAIRLVQWGAKPLGALLGGFLGELVGLRAALWLAVAGGVSGVVWLWLSPVRTAGTADSGAKASPGTLPGREG